MAEETKNTIAAAIDAAEEIFDALEGLVERTIIDPSAPFAPDALLRLAEQIHRKFGWGLIKKALRCDVGRNARKARNVLHRLESQPAEETTVKREGTDD